MKKSRIFLSFILCMFFGSGLTVTAQQNDYEWSWATRGGGPRDLSSNAQNPPSSQHSQKINTIAIDHANNYYFLADIGSENAPGTATTFGNIPNDTIAIPTYNDPGGSNYYSPDTYLVSTTCKGEFRWHKTIGGGGNNISVDIDTDAQDGIYITGRHFITPSWQIPVHYDQDSIKGMPVGNNLPSVNNKGIYLIKYDTDGIFQWLKEPESDSTTLFYQGKGGGAMSRGITVEDDGTVHWLVELQPWNTYETGTIVPDSTYLTGSYIGDTGVLKYDKDGNYINYIKLDIDMKASDLFFGDFAYDPHSNQYYLAARQDNSISAAAVIGGTAVTGDFYLAAFNANTGNVAWWHESDSGGSIYSSGHIEDFELDKQGNLYITGSLTGSGHSFAGYTNTDTVASCPVLIKLDSNGQLIWGTNAEDSSPAFSYVTVNDDEVIIGLGLAGQVTETVRWDGLVYYRPSGSGIDPVVIRFDKQTGAALAMHDIVGAGTGRWDNIRAVAVDRAGHIVAGGLMTSPFIFKDHPVVPQLDRMAVSKSDFFIAQLAKVGVSCDDLVGVEDVQKPKLRIYPNPAGDLLHWQADVGIVGITLYDLYGRMVKQHPATGQSGTLSVDSLSTGSYIVVLKSENGQTVQKILIKE